MHFNYELFVTMAYIAQANLGSTHVSVSNTNPPLGLSSDTKIRSICPRPIQSPQSSYVRVRYSSDTKTRSMCPFPIQGPRSSRVCIRLLRFNLKTHGHIIYCHLKNGEDFRPIRNLVRAPDELRVRSRLRDEGVQSPPDGLPDSPMMRWKTDTLWRAALTSAAPMGSSRRQGAAGDFPRRRLNLNFCQPWPSSALQSSWRWHCYGCRKFHAKGTWDSAARKKGGFRSS